MNTIKTFVLLAALTALMLLVGTALGGRGGMIIALMFAVIMNFSAYWFSDKLVLSMYGARPLPPEHLVSRILSELADRAAIPTPKAYLIEDATPNAFATGRNPDNASIAVTEGLLSLVSHEELTGVLAHEMAHVIHRDTLLSVVAATIAGAISGIANMFMWLSMFGGARSDDEGGVNPIVGILLMILAPMAASLIQMAISRSREFAADEGGARLCGEPMWLANALMKLEAQNRSHVFSNAESHPATAHLFIVNPLNGKRFSELFRTHPLTEERVKRLQAMVV